MEGAILSGKINFEYLIHHLIMTFFPYRCPIVTLLLCQKTIVMPCRATLTLTAKRRPQLKRPSTSNWSKSDVLLYRRQTITTTSTIETWWIVIIMLKKSLYDRKLWQQLKMAFQTIITTTTTAAETTTIIIGFLHLWQTQQRARMFPVKAKETVRRYYRIRFLMHWYYFILHVWLCPPRLAEC